MPPASSSMTMKRIHREIADVKKEDLGAIALAPTQDSLYHWKATIPGPQGSPYEGGIFGVDIQLPPDYPFSAPKVTFTTRIYHMNISDKGNICIDILKQNWSPALSLFKVMLSLSSLLTDPNPHDPLGEARSTKGADMTTEGFDLVPSIATEYTRHRVQHDRTAKRWTELYARPPPPPTPASGSRSKKSKGKGKASTPQIASSSRTEGNAVVGSSSSNKRRPQSEPIVVEDDASASVPTRHSGRKRQREPDVIDVDLVEEERPRRRVRVSGPRLRSSAEVIVIDD